MLRARRARAGVVSTCLVASVLAMPPTTSSGAAKHHHTAASCRPTWLRASVASRDTAPQGSGLKLAETNVSAGSCALVSPLRVQLLGREGQKVVRFVTTPSFAPERALLETYQGTLSVSVHSAMICRRRPMVAAIRITSGDATSVVHLGLPIPVCASHPHALTVSKVSFPHPPPCRNGALKTLVGWPNGTAGTIYYGIRFQNLGVTACTVHGVPTVLPIAADGAAVGPPARPEHLNARVSPVVLGVHDGVTAWANFGVVETGNFQRLCVRAHARRRDPRHPARLLDHGPPAPVLTVHEAQLDQRRRRGARVALDVTCRPGRTWPKRSRSSSRAALRGEPLTVTARPADRASAYVASDAGSTWMPLRFGQAQGGSEWVLPALSS